MLAQLHEDVVVIGGLDHVKDTNYVIVLEAAVDLQLLLDCLCHVRVVVDSVSLQVHCDFSIIFTAIKA